MISGYPRPQLVRTGHALLDGEWGYAVDPADIGARERWYASPHPFTRTIQVPYPPESPESGIGEDPDGPLWYRREFTIEPRPGERQLLHFEGVDQQASIWLNGIHLGDHEGSQARFNFDITAAALRGDNVLVVRAVDEVGDLEQPRGKQDWLPEPHVIWYRRTSGIWRSVWWEPVPATRIDSIVMTPRDDLRSVEFEARLAGPVDETLNVEITFTLRGLTLARAAFGAAASTCVQGVIVVDDPRVDTEPDEILWTPESPTLIDALIVLRRSGAVVDTVTSYLGLRTIGANSSQVLLNGRPYFLRLVLEQGYWPKTHLSAPSVADLDREARLIRELGFNGLRMHQTSADPRFLECCDRLGLVVLADAAAAYRFSTRALRRTSAELTAVVERDVNHPSVIGWIPFNESWGVPGLQTSRRQQHAVEAMYHLLKALDPSRLAFGNDGWHYTVGDLVGVHDYTQSAADLDRCYSSARDVERALRDHQPAGRPLVLPGRGERAAALPVLLSEFGGLNAHSDLDAWSGYGEVIGVEQLADKFAELVSRVGPDSGLAGYCYTQLTDTAQEKNGLLTESRESKCRPELLRAAQHGPSASA